MKVKADSIVVLQRSNDTVVSIDEDTDHIFILDELIRL